MAKKKAYNTKRFMNVFNKKTTSPGSILGGNIQLNNTLGAKKNPKVVGTYLKLDASNDPITSSLEVTGNINAKHSGQPILFAESTGANQSAYLWLKNSGTGSGIVQADGALQFRAYGLGELARFHTNGYLGIGTATPVAKLEVDGEARLSDSTDMGSNDASLATKKYVDDNHPPVSVRTASITVEDCTDSEDVSIFFTNKSITISEMRAVISGSSSPSITWTIRHSTDRSAAGNEVVTGGTTTTSTTTGSDVTSFNDATIPADSFVWFETTADSGTVTELHVTLVFTED